MIVQWLMIIISVLEIYHIAPTEGAKKVLNIGIFLDDDQYDLSITVVKAAVTKVNLYSRTYELKEHIFRTHKTNMLKVGKELCNVLEEGVAALFGPESLEVNEIVQSVASSLQIPHFQMFWNPRLSSFPGSFPHASVFNLYPSPYTLSKALATLVRENDWMSYTVIYESDDGLLRLQETLKQRNPTDSAVAFRKLGPSESHRSVLKEIKSSGVQHFILDCELDHILDILREARELKLLSEYHSYILTNLDAHTLDWSEFKDGKTNLTLFRLLNTTGPILDAVTYWNQNGNFENDTQILPNKIKTKTALLYDALNLFITVFSEVDTKEELVLSPLSCVKLEISSHGARISDAIKERKFTRGLLGDFLTNPIQEFDPSGQRLDFHLDLIEHGVKGFRTIGTWNSSVPKVIDSHISSTVREHELKEIIQGTTFRVVSKIGAPYLIERKSPNGTVLIGNDRFEGYAMDLMQEICKPENLNCSYTFQLVPDGRYGNYDLKTKQWNGLIRELLELRADLAICDLTITYERRKAVDFTMPFMTLGISILYAKAVKEPPELLSFSHPLSLDIWLYMATAYLVISMIIFLVARLNPNDWENPHPCNLCPRELENIWNVKNCFWLTLGSIMAQGCDILPKGISTRMVTSMWWFFSLIMTACYTANLAAFLTMERMGPTIESAEDLAAQTKIKYGCVSAGATASFFRDTNFSTYHRMWVQMEADPGLFEKKNEEGVKRVINGKRQYAFLMESSTIEYEMERNCDLIQVGNTLDSKGYGIAMPTNARYRKSINEAILKLQEMGVLLKLKDKWWKKMHGGGQCNEDKQFGDETATELGLDHVGGVFVVLAAGICIALTLAICEFLWNVRKVAVVEHLTPREALIKEFKFAINIWARKKNVISTNNSRERSLDNIK